MRLAQLYGLLHVNVATILAQLQHMDAETQKVSCVDNQQNRVLLGGG